MPSPRPHWSRNAPRVRLDMARVVWQSVTSSNVRRIGYDPASMTLVVVFGGPGRSDQGYVYPDFPRTVWEAFVRSPSKGRFVWQKIRDYGDDGRYPFKGPFPA